MAAEAKEEADKVEDAAADKDNDKLTSSKPRQPVCHSKKKKKELPKRTEPLDDNLTDYFGPSQSQNSQEMADIMPVDTPKKSEEVKSKNDPDGSSCQRVDKSSEPLLELNSQDSEVPSLRKTSKSSQGSVGEGPSEPLPTLEQSMQQPTKPETEDSSSLSSSSSGNESSDEEVPSKWKRKELPPPLSVKKRDRSQSPHHSRCKKLKS